MTALIVQILGLVLLLLAWAVITVQASNFRSWAVLGTLALGVWIFLWQPSFFWILLVAAVWLVPMLIGLLPELWTCTVRDPLWRITRQSFSPLSSTEREALEAGESGWEQALFTGAPDWVEVLKSEPAPLSEAEQAFLDGPVEQLCGLLDDWKVTTEDFDLPPAAWDLIRRERFFGMVVPQQYGGFGFSARAHSEVVMKIATCSITAAVTVMVPNSLGPGKLLLHYGTTAQKDRYLHRLASGEETPCFALTGPHAGSDAAAIPDSGIVCQQDIDGELRLGIRLNWEKRYITLAPVATLLGLAFRLYDPEGLLGSSRDLGVTLALVPVQTPGVEIGRRHMPLQVPFLNGPTVGRDVFIPIEQVIGEREGVGRGWQMLMACLGEGRAISLPALSVAAGKWVSLITGAYSGVRRQFSLPLARFEGIEEVLARIGGNTYLMDAVRCEVAALEDRGACSSVASAITKQQLTERMRQVVMAAMDVHAGAAICLGPRNQVARLYQAVPIAITVEGANILTRSMIIFGQGLVRCHPYLRQEMDCLQMEDNEEARGVFSTLLRPHLSTTVQSACRALLLGLSGGRYPAAEGLPGHLNDLARQNACFVLSMNVLLVLYGGGLKRQERMSARLADMLSAQYMAVCVARQFNSRGAHEEDLVLRDWALAECRRDFYRALNELIDNLPQRVLRVGMRACLLPLGRPSSVAPSDRADHKVATLLSAPGPARERLCAGVFRDQPSARRLEQALAESGEVEPLRRALRQAIHEGKVSSNEHGIDMRAAVEQGVLSAGQAEALTLADANLAEVIAVDAFAAETWKRAQPIQVQEPEA